MKVKRIIALALLFALCLSIIAVAASGDIIVYITDTGAKYHRVSCGSLWNSSHAITLQQAINRGYGPCGRCHPPAYNYAQPSPSRSVQDRFDDMKNSGKVTSTPTPTAMVTPTPEPEDNNLSWWATALCILFFTPIGWIAIGWAGERIADAISARRLRKGSSRKD